MYCIDQETVTWTNVKQVEGFQKKELVSERLRYLNCESLPISDGIWE